MNIQPRMMISEQLDYIAEGVTFDDQVTRTKKIAELDGTFAPLMRMACILEEKLSGLPEGMPDTYKPETDVPDGTSHTTVRQEFRRLKNFLSRGTMQQLTKARRETAWLQIMEGLHWKEASVMVHVKDQTLLDVYPNMREVLKNLGVKIDIADIAQPIKKKKTKPVKL